MGEQHLQTVSKRPAATSPGLSRILDYGMPLAVIALCVGFGLVQPRFATWSNAQNLLVQMPALAILACGQAFPVLAGGFDLSVGATISLVSVVFAMVSLSVGLPLGLLAAAVVGSLVGLGNGLIIAHLRITPFVQTLGMLSVASGAALLLTGGLPVQNMPPNFFWLGSAFWGPIPVSAVVAFAVFLVGWLVLERTPLGRYIYAIGGNEESARISGIPVSTYTVVAFTAAGLLAGIASVLASSRVASGIPTLGTGMELQSIAAVVIGGVSLKGGTGRLPGVLLGVFLLSIIQNGLNLANVSSYIQLMVTGLITVLAVGLDQYRRKV